MCRTLEYILMESSKETGCQAPEGPILCINNCGFFGSATTMNMCSKCHRDMVLKQENAKLVENIVNGSVDSKVADIISTATNIIPKTITTEAASSPAGSSSVTLELKPKEGPNRCSTCSKRVGLTGFECRCGNLYCASHRYSDKHDCQFDYQSAARDAIAKANPVVRGNKLDKI